MKTIATAIILAASCLFAGCSTMNQALVVTQNISGSGSATVSTPISQTTVSVENARKEDGNFKADKIDLIHNGKLTGTKIEIHATDYSRPLIEE